MLDGATIHGLLTAVELKDAATAAHTWRVTLYARALAESFGISGERLRRLSLGAALHDVGKIDIDDAILRKAGPLTDAEFDAIKRHPAIGYDRLVGMGVTDPEVLGLVRSHHERWDGRGYPDGLAGTDIPEAARFFSVVDAFDAMTSVRTYRSIIGDDAARVALKAIEADEGTRYCGLCVEAFASLFRTGRLDWILHYYNDGVDVPDFGSIEHLDDAIRSLKPE
ncbi:MAG: HD domain-containing phosphohydrolase [Planctomycetota bacterium]